MSANPSQASDTLAQALGTKMSATPALAPVAVAPESSQVLAQLDKTPTAAKQSELARKMFSQSQEQATAADLAKQGFSERNATAERKSGEEFAAKEKAGLEALGKQRVEQSAFAPTQENVKDLASLFGAVNVMAFMAGGRGRYSGMAALKNMSGAMEGYKQGRTDLFNKELKEFDKNLAVTKAHNELIKEKTIEFSKLMSIDKEQATRVLKEIAALDGGGIAGQLARSQRTKELYEYVEKTAQATKSAELAKEKLTAAHAERLSAQSHAEKMQAASFAHAEKLANIKAGAKALTSGDDVTNYLAEKGIHIADKKERAAVQSAVNASSNLQALKEQVLSDPTLVGRQGQIRQFTDKYYQSLKGTGPSLDESKVNEADQPALRFAKKYASMLTRYEQTLAGSGRSGSTVAFQKRYNNLLSQNQFNPAGMAALLDDMKVEVTRSAREKSPKITAAIMDEMAANFESGIDGSTPVAQEKATPEEIKAYADKNFNGDQNAAKANLKAKGFL